MILVTGTKHCIKIRTRQGTLDTGLQFLSAVDIFCFQRSCSQSLRLLGTRRGFWEPRTGATSGPIRSSLTSSTTSKTSKYVCWSQWACLIRLIPGSFLSFQGVRAGDTILGFSFLQWCLIGTEVTLSNLNTWLGHKAQLYMHRRVSRA